MLTYCILLFIALLPPLLLPNKKGLGLSLGFVCLLCCIRYGQGDYFAYNNFFKVAVDSTWADYFGTMESWKECTIAKHKIYEVEILYFALEKLFGELGFECFVACITIFFFCSCYLFIQEFVSAKYYWLSLFFLYNPIIVICYMSALRQSIACAFFELVLVCIARHGKKWLIFLLILLGTAFHASLFLFFPLVFLNKINFKKLMLYMGMALLASPILALCILKMAHFFSYGHYVDGAGYSNSICYTFIIVCMIIGGIGTSRIKEYKDSLIATLAMGLVFTRVFASLVPDLYYLNRVGMYFEFCTIAFFPVVLENKKSYATNVGIFCVIIFMLIRAGLFFENPAWIGNSKFYYSTIFNKESWGEDLSSFPD